MTSSADRLTSARGKGDPGGGCSLFLVPKFLVNDDGSLGARNDMPQKRNPVICEAIVEAARSVQHVPGVLFGAMLQEQERGIGHGYRERTALSDAVQQLSGAASLSEELLAGLEVDAGRIAQNLNLTNGLVYTEAMMIHLSDRIGRIEAHRVTG